MEKILLLKVSFLIGLKRLSVY